MADRRAATDLAARELRGCVTNFRSTIADAKVCIDTIVELAERLEEGHA